MRPSLAQFLWSLCLVQAASAQSTSLENGVLQVGIDAGRGCAISWLSTAGSGRNLINIHDEGRYLQQSYYAGQAIDRRSEGQWAPEYSP